MTIQRFAAGDPVPAHVLDVEPLTPGGPRPSIVFSNDTDLVDAGDRYVMLPVTFDNVGVVRVVGDDHEGCHIALFAPFKSLEMALSFESVGHRLLDEMT